MMRTSSPFFDMFLSHFLFFFFRLRSAEMTHRNKKLLFIYLTLFSPSLERSTHTDVCRSGSKWNTGEAIWMCSLDSHPRNPLHDSSGTHRTPRHRLIFDMTPLLFVRLDSVASVQSVGLWLKWENKHNRTVTFTVFYTPPPQKRVMCYITLPQTNPIFSLQTTNGNFKITNLKLSKKNDLSYITNLKTSGFFLTFDKFNVGCTEDMIK